MATSIELEKKLQIKRRDLDTRMGEAKAYLQRAKALQAGIDDKIGLRDDLERVTILLNTIGEDRQMQAQETIEELVTRGLQTIFDSSLSFHIIQTIKGRSVSADFIVRTTLGDTFIETPVLDARGGGLAATIGFLLRVVVLLLSSGTKQDNVLILDETFAHVSDEYLPPLGEFLRELVDKTGIQIIMVTHQPEFMEYSDKSYRFSIHEGKTEVREGD